MRKPHLASFGRLVYVAGPSGAGKDALIAYARRAGPPGIVYAHRYITRPLSAGGEPHVPLHTAEFDARLASGLFALDWTANGVRYGIGTEIEIWLARGLHVVVNGSRAYLPVALRRFPELRLVWVSAAAERRRERLTSRQREDTASIERRMLRAEAYEAPPVQPHLTIANDGTVDEAAGPFIAFLCGLESDAVRPAHA